MRGFNSASPKASGRCASSVTPDVTSDNDNTKGMTSSQPYLIRGIFEWIVDNDLTPYLMVDANKRGTVVPEDYLDEKGRIILNISPNATSGWLMTNEEITFNARFSGQSIAIVVPVYSVRAIYARENGQGMMFDESKEPSGNDGEPDKRRVSLEAVASVEEPGESTITSNAESDSKTDKPCLLYTSPSPRDRG